MRIKAADLVDEIAQLDTKSTYPYFSGNSRLKIVRVIKPEGPVQFVNINKKGEVGNNIRNITKQQLSKIALVCSTKPDYPLHIDRVFSAGGNTRSALETLLAYTPHFFMCFPAREDPYSGEVKRNLKHIMWCPQDTHPLGEIAIKEWDEVITEIELGVDFGKITLTGYENETTTVKEEKTLHTQMQIALIEIGNALNFRSWIARNDRSIRVGEGKLGEMEGVITSFNEVSIFNERDVQDAASLIDCIWFTANGRQVPAVIEVEHSTSIKSGLDRMLELERRTPGIRKVYVIVAPDKRRGRVIEQANMERFQELQARFMSYSTVRELLGLIQRYKLKEVGEKFILPFMEQIVND